MCESLARSPVEGCNESAGGRTNLGASGARAKRVRTSSYRSSGTVLASPVASKSGTRAMWCRTLRPPSRRPCHASRLWRADRSGSPGRGRTRGLSAAATNVVEHVGAELLAGSVIERRDEPVADAGQADMPERVERLVRDDEVTVGKKHSPAHDAYRRVVGTEPRPDPIRHLA
jgi:hypothetical protein